MLWPCSVFGRLKSKDALCKAQEYSDARAHLETVPLKLRDPMYYERCHLSVTVTQDLEYKTLLLDGIYSDNI